MVTEGFCSECAGCKKVWIIFQEECHNFIKVLLRKNNDTLFVCGTNAFNPSCRNYKVSVIRLLEAHILEVFQNLLWSYLQPPQRGNSMPPGFFSLVGLNVFLHMGDPDQASKLPVSSGLIDVSLESLASIVSIRTYSWLFRTPTYLPHIQFAFIYHVDFLSPFLSLPHTPPSPLWAQKHTYIVSNYFKRYLKIRPLETVVFPLGKIFQEHRNLIPFSTRFT